MNGPTKTKPREPWLMVRQELSAGRRVWLMMMSFVGPILLWCLLTYVPWFHRDVKLQLTAERRDPAMANFTAGDRVAKDYFAGFVGEVRQMNEAILVSRAQGATAAGSKRTNLKRMRQIKPVAEANGWLTGVPLDNGNKLDAKLFEVWGGIAEGELVATSPALSKENLRIIDENWALMKPAAPYSYDTFPDQPLLHLLPQAVSASPVFLPAPHECIKAAIADFTTKPANDQPWMHQRLLGSLKVVFGGFLMACVVGVPLGLLCGSYDLFSKAAEPFVDFFRYMPAPTFSLLLVAAFGVEGAPKIALVFIGTFPHMLLMLANTTRLLDKSLLEAAQTLGASRGNLMLRVVIPGILPKLYNDLRVLLGWAWTWLVIAELIGTKTGLTAFIDTQGGRRNFDRVFPVIIMVGLFGFLTDQTLQIIARKLFPWEYASGKRGFFATLWMLLTFWKRRQRAAAPAVTPSLEPQPTGAADVSAA